VVFVAFTTSISSLSVVECPLWFLSPFYTEKAVSYFKGRRNIALENPQKVFMLRDGDKLWPDGPLGSYADLTLTFSYISYLSKFIKVNLYWIDASKLLICLIRCYFSSSFAADCDSSI